MAANKLATVNKLAVIDKPSFNLPILSDPQGILEIIQMNLQDIEPRFDRVKIPSGGGLAFELPGDDQPEIAQEIVGVILDHYKVNAYWKDRYSGANNPPDCSALDGQIGVGDPGGQCATCPYNQFGSAVDEHGNPTRGKSCKNLHRVYILREGEVFPILIALPPTSISNFTNYMKRLCGRKPVPFFGCITKIKLQKATSSTGIVYSQAVFSKVADLSKEEMVALRSYANSLQNTMRAVKVEATEYEIEPGDSVAVSEAEPF